MYRVGVVPGKFFPPHRGHLNQIIRAATMCDMVYVVVSDNENLTRLKCRKDNIKFISLKTRALWMSLELQNIDHIKVIILDEEGLPEYPEGSKLWCRKLLDTVPEKFKVIFGGELEYQHTYMKHLPSDIEYNVYDYRRSRYPVSGTEVRKDPLKHWDYILGPARPHFAKRVLITGTESCGKTTLTKYLAKIYHTSWSEEYGRYYSRDYLGGNENIFQLKDFERIAQIQQEQDEHALRNANKIVFFDTDAVVTQYYCGLYLRMQNPRIEYYVDPDKYDIVLLMGPEVKWFNDGLRFKSEQTVRNDLHDKLQAMYINRGFKDKLIKINEKDYHHRLQRAIKVSDELLGLKKPKFVGMG